MNSPNKYYIGSQSFDLNIIREKEKLQLRIKNLLLLKNVNFLFGNGTSLSLGAPSITSLKYIVNQIDSNFNDGKESEKYALNKIKERIGDQFENIVKFLNDFTNYLNEDIDLETALSLFIQISYSSDKVNINENQYDSKLVDLVLIFIKGFIFYSCKYFVENINNELLNPHKEFLRKSLLRPTSLPRQKIFTINYDLILEKCLDELGVFYFDGFVGSFEKRMRTESYNYDLYYPGEVTEGNVNRVDRVLQLFKLHGSLNWKRVKESATNIYGIKQEYPDQNEISDLVIYPSTLKYGEILGYPYSEMLRYFSSSIFKQQTVLFTFGYSFRDEHINRIIYQALSIPTFNLIVVLPEGKEVNESGIPINEELTRIIEKVDSKRIIVVSGGQLKDDNLIGSGTFKDFVLEIMPDMEEMNIQAKINAEIEKIFTIDKTEKKDEPNNIDKKIVSTNNVSSQNENKNTLVSKLKKIFTR